MISPVYTTSMNDQQRALFYSEYQRVAKDELVGVLLAFFLGTFGAHRFYMGQTGLGILYLLFFWTGIPAIVGFIECFLMPGRVRAYNAMQAEVITARILQSGTGSPVSSYAVAPPVPAPAKLCPACRGALQPDAAFCARCGTAA